MTSATVLRHACQECRRLKNKCDMSKPSCGRCKRLSRSCVYVPRKPNVGRLAAKLEALQNLTGTTTSNVPAALSHPFVKILSEESWDREPASHDVLPHYAGPLTEWPSFLTAPGQVSQSYIQEGYQTVVTRARVEKALRKWDRGLDIPEELSELLLRVFLPFRLHYGFHTPYLTSFTSNFLLPATHPNSIHPCLVISIYMVACSLCGGYASEFEPLFLSRAKANLKRSLADKDRLMHMFWASLIIGCYLGRTPRFVECSEVLCSTVLFAIKCGIPTTFSAVEGSNAIMPSPKTEVDSLERITLWHTLCMAEAALVAALGMLPLPSASFDESRSPFFGERLMRSFDPLPKNEMYYQFKARRLTRSVCRFVAVYKDGTQAYLNSVSFTRDFNTLSSILSELQRDIPFFGEPLGLLPDEIYGLGNPCLVHAHFNIFASTMLLFNLMARRSEDASRVVLEAAYSLSGMVRRIRGKGEFPRVHAFVDNVTHIHTAIEVLIREIHRCQASSSPQDVICLQKAEKELDVLLYTIQDYTHVFPKCAARVVNIVSLLQGRDAYDTI